MKRFTVLFVSLLLLIHFVKATPIPMDEMNITEHIVQMDYVNDDCDKVEEVELENTQFPNAYLAQEHNKKIIRRLPNPFQFSVESLPMPEESRTPVPMKDLERRASFRTLAKTNSLNRRPSIESIAPFNYEEPVRCSSPTNKNAMELARCASPTETVDTVRCSSPFGTIQSTRCSSPDTIELHQAGSFLDVKPVLVKGALTKVTLENAKKLIVTHKNSIPIIGSEQGITQVENNVLAPIDVQLIDFHALLQDCALPPLSLNSFREYCEYIKSPEGLEFYLKVQKFKVLHKDAANSIENLDSLLMHVRELYEMLPALNLDASIHQPLAVACETLLDENLYPPLELFELAERQLFYLMRLDILPRYLQTFKRNVSCPNKVPCFSVAIISGAAYAIHLGFEIYWGEPQRTRLYLLPALFVFVVSSSQLLKRFCFLIWIQSVMQEPFKQKVSYVSVQDSAISRLQYQYMLQIAQMAVFMFLLTATSTVFIPSYPVSNYRW